MGILCCKSKKEENEDSKYEVREVRKLQHVYLIPFDLIVHFNLHLCEYVGMFELIRSYFDTLLS